VPRAACLEALVHGRSISGLAKAAENFRSSILAACVEDEVSQGSTIFPLSVGGSEWTSVSRQAHAASLWPKHPLESDELLHLCELLVNHASNTCVTPVNKGAALCQAHRSFGTVFTPRRDGVSHAGLVCLLDAKLSASAVSETVGLLLRGHVVSIAAAAGETSELARQIAAPFPPQMLQVVPLEDGLPNCVRVATFIGRSACDTWRETTPCREFGGFTATGLAHGMASTSALMVARTDVAALERLPRSRYRLSDEAADLLSLLSTTPSTDAPTLPGLPPPRWSQSAYDRGVEEVHDLLDVLWAFRETEVIANSASTVALCALEKHFIINTAFNDIPEDVVKAATVTALSPFNEDVTLHAVGTGASFSRDPLRSFRRLVQSGRGGLGWRVMEHASPTVFCEWLSNRTSAKPFGLFGSLRGHEIEVWRLSAAAGGVAWGPLFVAEPLDQLRRWTSVVHGSEDSTDTRLRAQKFPEIELLKPRFREG